MNRSDEPERDDEERAFGADPTVELEHASENVLDGWPDEPAESRTDGLADEPSPAPEPETGADDLDEAGDALASAPEELADPPAEAPELGEQLETSAEHAPGELVVPPGYAVLEGSPDGRRRAVGIVVSRFNGDVTGGLLTSALDELEVRGVGSDSITVMPVPGAFELPIAAMALAKTRRFACIVALGCVIRGDTPHFDYVASEAASGLQLAAIETGVPVAFGVLTLDRQDQAEPRLAKGAEAVETALEMADLFANLRAAAAR
jgi:6,7-dimethyl-8-ribityllumazine synthase